ncbi:MAG: TonB-dependent receptor [Methylococcaceae bacterium]|nr:TonB-dependent receptor [Methylococcaceae bacterium]
MTYHLKPLSAALLITLAHNVQAEKKHRFEIPAQPLSSALQHFAEQSGVAMLYTEASAQGKYSSGLNGDYNTGEGLERLVAGSGLIPAVAPDGTVTLKPSAFIKTAADSNEQILPKVTVEADAETDLYDPINTTQPYNKSYAVSNSSTATKTDTPIMDTPASIRVIPQAVLRDQQATRLQDAVKNVSGVQLLQAAGGQYEDFIIRGFGGGVSYDRFRNGIRLPALTFDFANVEQVDVLKGSAAMLYGRMEPGGIVNVVTKKPLDTPYYSIQQQFGSFDFYRTTLDATGPITDDKSLAYRFDLGYTSRNSFRDFVTQDRLLVSPSLHWQATPDTEFNLNFEYLRENPSVADTGIPAIGKSVVNVPIHRNYIQPGPFNQDQINSTLVDFNWSHNFNDNWKIQNGIVANQVEYNFRDTPVAYIQPLLEGTPNPEVRRGLYFEDINRDSHTVYLNLTGKFETFGVKHNVLLGGDHYDLEVSNSGFFGLNHAILNNFSDEGLKYFTFVNLRNPNYNAFPFSFNQLDNLRKNAPNDFGKSNTSWYGLYFQDQLSFLDDKIQLLLGGRYDWSRLTQGVSFTSFKDIALEARNEDHFSPRVGFVVRPWNWVSWYGSYLQGFGVNNGRTGNGIPLRAETSEQFETGLKFEAFDGKLTSNLAYYHLTKHNLLTQVDDGGISNTIGEARSQGIELDIAGQLTDGLSLIGTYAYTDGKITNDKAAIFGGPTGEDVVGFSKGFTGNRLPNVPEHSGSTWLKYAFQIPELRGLSLGVGAYMAGARQGDNENSYQLPGYVRADTYAAYTFDIGKTKLTTQLNVNNFLDKRYYFAGQPYNTSKAFNIIADPLTVMGSVRLEY